MTKLFLMIPDQVKLFTHEYLHLLLYICILMGYSDKTFFHFQKLSRCIHVNDIVTFHVIQVAFTIFWRNLLLRYFYCLFQIGVDPVPNESKKPKFYSYFTLWYLCKLLLWMFFHGAIISDIFRVCWICMYVHLNVLI